MSKRYGFTLIELLVVVSIISLLSSVVLSSLNSAREKGRLAAAKSFSSGLQRSAGELNVAGWYLDEGAGTTAIDFTGNGRTGTLLNTTSPWVADSPWGTGYSVSLDGSNDYISVNDNQNLKYRGGDMTLAIWIKPDSAETSGGRIMSKPWNGNGQYNYTLEYSSGRDIAVYILGASSYSLGTGEAVPADRWSFVAATFSSNGQVSIYVDGKLKRTGTHSISNWTPTLGDLNLPLAIGTLYPYGSWGGNTGYSFHGQIDDPRIYTKTLTASEIGDLYALGAPSDRVAAR